MAYPHVERSHVARRRVRFREAAARENLLHDGTLPTPASRRDIRRRAAIEPVIGHKKSDGRLARYPPRGTEGDIFHAIM